MNVSEFEFMFAKRSFVRTWLLKAGMTDTRHADVDDAVQEVYRRVWAGRDRYVAQGDALYFPMLKRISHSVAVDFARRAAARHDSPMPPDFDAPAPDGPALAEARTTLLQILGHLNPQHRALLWMRFVWGCTYEQIATSLGITPSQVTSRLKNAMQAAKKVAKNTHQESQPCQENTPSPPTAHRSTRWTRRTAA